MARPASPAPEAAAAGLAPAVAAARILQCSDSDGPSRTVSPEPQLVQGLVLCFRHNGRGTERRKHNTRLPRRRHRLSKTLAGARAPDASGPFSGRTRPPHGPSHDVPAQARVPAPPPPRPAAGPRPRPRAGRAGLAAARADRHRGQAGGEGRRRVRRFYRPLRGGRPGRHPRPRLRLCRQDRTSSTGRIVKAGDPLFTIDQRPYQAALEEAQASLESRQGAIVDFTTGDLARAEDLRKTGNISGQRSTTSAPGRLATARADREPAPRRR